MAEWCNASLTVVGASSEVTRFAKHARQEPPGPLTWVPDILVSGSEVILLPRPQGRPDSPFIPDMWIGEGGKLWSHRIRSIGDGLSQKKYHFQIRNDDGREHFRKVSLGYPSLHFVLVNHWYLESESRSFLIHDGRTRCYEMAQQLIDSTLAKYGWEPDLKSDDDDDYLENDDKEYEASWEMMHLAETHWLDGLLHRMRAAARSGERSTAASRSNRRSKPRRRN
jgi:hypothetical protein